MLMIMSSSKGTVNSDFGVVERVSFRGAAKDSIPPVNSCRGSQRLDNTSQPFTTQLACCQDDADLLAQVSCSQVNICILKPKHTRECCVSLRQIVHSSERGCQLGTPDVAATHRTAVPMFYSGMEDNDCAPVVAPNCPPWAAGLYTVSAVGADIMPPCVAHLVIKWHVGLAITLTVSREESLKLICILIAHNQATKYLTQLDLYP